MSEGERVSRHNAVLIVLHWLIAVLLVVQVGSILARQGFVIAAEGGRSPEGFALILFHKSLGLTILLLVCVRLVWRAVAGLAEWPSDMPQRERKAVLAVETTLYGLLLLLPLTGIAASMIAGFPLDFFGQSVIASLWDGDMALYAAAYLVHKLVFFALFATIAAHVALGLRRHYVDDPHFLRRIGMPSSRA